MDAGDSMINMYLVCIDMGEGRGENDVKETREAQINYFYHFLNKKVSVFIQEEAMNDYG